MLSLTNQPRNDRIQQMTEVRLPHNAEYQDQQGNLSIDVDALFKDQRRRSIGIMWNPGSVKPVFEAIFYEVKWIDRGREMSAIKSLTFDSNARVGEEGVVDVMLTSDQDPHVEHTQYRLYKSELDEKKRLTKSQPDPNNPDAPWITRFGVVGSNQYVATNEARDLQAEFNRRKDEAFRMDKELRLSGVPGYDNISAQPVLSFWHQEEIYRGDTNPAPIRPQNNIPQPQRTDTLDLTADQWNNAWEQLTGEEYKDVSKPVFDADADRLAREAHELEMQRRQKEQEARLEAAEKEELDKALWDLEFDVLNHQVDVPQRSQISRKSNQLKAERAKVLHAKRVKDQKKWEALADELDSAFEAVKDADVFADLAERSQGIQRKGREQEIELYSWDDEFNALNKEIADRKKGGKKPAGAVSSPGQVPSKDSKPAGSAKDLKGFKDFVPVWGSGKKKGKEGRGGKGTPEAVDAPEYSDAPEGFRYLHMKNGQVRRQRISDGKFVGSDWKTSKERNLTNGRAVKKNGSNGNGHKSHEGVIILPSTQLPEGVEIEVGVGVRVKLSSVPLGDKVH